MMKKLMFTTELSPAATVGRLLVFGSMFVAFTGHVAAQEASERVEQSCRAGMAETKRRIFAGYPRATDAEKAQASAAFAKREDAYCGCMVRSIPRESLEPDSLPYVEFILRRPMNDARSINDRFALAQEGLSREKMGLVSGSLIEPTMKCSF